MLEAVSPEERFLATYRAQNEAYPIDCVYRLSGRGFFSEINNLLNAMAVCLLTRMRLRVDTRKFGGLKSNVGRFVHLWADPGQTLVSVDRLKAWTAR